MKLIDAELKFALGVLKWSPNDYWSASRYEFQCAYRGYCEHKGVSKKGTNKTTLSKKEIELFSNDCNRDDWGK